MSYVKPTVLLDNLSRGDYADLLDYVPEEAATTQQAQLSPGDLGEPATLAVLVVITMASLAGLCAWAAAKGRSVKLSGSVNLPSGVGGSFALEIGADSSPEELRGQLARQGVPVEA